MGGQRGIVAERVKGGKDAGLLGAEMATGERRSPRVELGVVRATPGDAELVQQARVRLSKWLERESEDCDNRYRPQRLGAILSQAQFNAWAVRYAIVRAEHGHNAWPERILVPRSRVDALGDRRVVLGTCRVDPAEARAFRQACLSFFETFCRASEDLNQAKFLTLAVVGLAECVLKTAALQNLPMPPWSGRQRFRSPLPTGAERLSYRPGSLSRQGRLAQREA